MFIHIARKSRRPSAFLEIYISSRCSGGKPFLLDVRGISLVSETFQRAEKAKGRKK